MTEWADVFPELATPTQVREAFDQSLEHAADRGRRFTLGDGLRSSLLAGKFRAVVWPGLTEQERASYLERVRALKSSVRTAGQMR